MLDQNVPSAFIGNVKVIVTLSGEVELLVVLWPKALKMVSKTKSPHSRV